jgi:hypothetical protein
MGGNIMPMLNTSFVFVPVAENATYDGYQMREKPDARDIEETRRLLDDFCVKGVNIPQFPARYLLLQWRRDVIRNALDDYAGIEVSVETPTRKVKRKSSGRPRKVTANDFTPYYEQLERAAFGIAEKRVVADKLQVSLATVNVLIRELRHGTRSWISPGPRRNGWG